MWILITLLAFLSALAGWALLAGGRKVSGDPDADWAAYSRIEQAKRRMREDRIEEDAA